MLNSAQGFVDGFFKKFYEEILQYSDSHYCNLDHIMSIFLFILESEPQMTINYIIFYN